MYLSVALGVNGRAAGATRAILNQCVPQLSDPTVSLTFPVTPIRSRDLDPAVRRQR